MILWESPDEIPFSIWASLNRPELWIYREENHSGYSETCIVVEGMSDSMTGRRSSRRDVSAVSFSWKATLVEFLACCGIGQQRSIPGSGPGYINWRGRNAIYKLLKSLESLTRAWLCEVEESIMNFIWGMEKEFGRLLHGRFQVVKLVFRQVRDKIQWKSRKVASQGMKIGHRK